MPEQTQQHSACHLNLKLDKMPSEAEWKSSVRTFASKAALEHFSRTKERLSAVLIVALFFQQTVAGSVR